MNTFIRILTISTFMALLSCGGTAERQKIATLSDAIDDYAYALRWGRTDDAVSYHFNEDGTRPQIDSSVMDSVRVTGFEIMDRTVNPEQTEATVKGELKYYQNDSATIRTLEYDQHWWYEPDSGQWFLDSNFPDF